MTLVSGLFTSQRGTCMLLRRSTRWEEGGLEETIGLGWDRPIKYHVGRSDSVVWIWTWMKTKNRESLELKRKWLTSKELDYIS